MTELSGIQIRAFAENDISGALELWSNVEGLGLTESDTPETIGLFLERNPSFSAVALTPDNRIVGAVLCGHNGRAGSLYHLAVATSARGLGIGRALVTYCFERLTEPGIPRCNIFVYTDNDEGNRFWMRNEWIDPTKWKVLQKTRYAIRVTTPRDHSRTVTNSTLVVSAAFASGFMHCSEGIPVLTSASDPSHVRQSGSSYFNPSECSGGLHLAKSRNDGDEESHISSS
jgi:putative acetyltransferase